MVLAQRGVIENVEGISRDEPNIILFDMSKEFKYDLFDTPSSICPLKELFKYNHLNFANESNGTGPWKLL